MLMGTAGKIVRSKWRNSSKGCGAVDGVAPLLIKGSASPRMGPNTAQIRNRRAPMWVPDTG
uniref:Uncharacterized protein n=1 Tax=Solanum demissum TaxID=50514 RepID=Q0KIM8_SOLDE|nr:hypothetical protein SDM1_4t00002 [Solanum demissum]ABI34332.1 hypothetical protein SDM1_40t00005 [Solanum demissum]